MAVIENRVTQEGDVLVIKTETPVVGLISLYSFIDTTQNESETDYFLKEFRYSINGGLIFSDWLELTVENISNVSITKHNEFVIEYRYTRVGDAPEVELEFNDILVSGETEALNYPTYDKTYFKNFFEIVDINVYGWALNVLEKIYQKGILPEYVKRGDVDNNVLQDEDFIVFWGSITHYFAVIVYMARQFRDISKNPILMEKFIESRGIELGKSDIEDSVYIFNNWVREISKRGTFATISKKVDGADIDGELLRLIGYTHPEEFMFSLLRPCEVGWCVGISSPTWKGTENMINLNKAYEFTKEVVDLTKYPILNPSKVSIEDGKILIASLGAGETAGIYNDGLASRRIIVSPNLDYEISFFVEVSNATTTPLTFSLKGYDAVGNNCSLTSTKTGVTSNTFISKKMLKNGNVVYWIRAILYNKNKTSSPSDTVYPSENNLRSNTQLRFIVPQILLDNSSGSVSTGTMKIHNLKIRPLKLNFSRGQMGMKNIIMSFMNVSNSLKDVAEIEATIRSSMINAGQFLKIKYISNE